MTITASEKAIQAETMLAIGAEPDLLLLRNSVGRARYVDRNGRAFYVPYGLMPSSPDLVGILRRPVPTCPVCHHQAALDIGTWFAMELKQPGEVAAPDQAKCHDVWRKFGAFVAVVHSVEEARAALARARKGARS